MSEIRPPEKMYLYVPLTETEQADLGRQLATSHHELRAMKSDHKAQLEDLKERQRDREGRLQATLDELAEKVRFGKELRDVEVRIVRNYETRRLEVTRLDTWERVPEKERDLEPAEYQQQLPLEEVRATWAEKVGEEIREAKADLPRNPISAIVQQSTVPVERWWRVYEGPYGDRSRLHDTVEAQRAIDACQIVQARCPTITQCWAEGPDPRPARTLLDDVQERLAEVAATDPSAGLPLDSELKAARPAPSAGPATVARQKRRAEIEARARKSGSKNGARRKHEDGE